MLRSIFANYSFYFILYVFERCTIDQNIAATEQKQKYNEKNARKISINTKQNKKTTLRFKGENGHIFCG